VSALPFVIWMLAWPMVFARSFKDESGQKTIVLVLFFLITWILVGALLYVRPS
jgi:hypothetical protein